MRGIKKKLRKLEIQSEMVNRRVGICVPKHLPLSYDKLQEKAWEPEGGWPNNPILLYQEEHTLEEYTAKVNKYLKEKEKEAKKNAKNNCNKFKK